MSYVQSVSRAQIPNRWYYVRDLSNSELISYESIHIMSLIYFEKAGWARLALLLCTDMNGIYERNVPGLSQVGKCMPCIGSKCRGAMVDTYPHPWSSLCSVWFVWFVQECICCTAKRRPYCLLLAIATVMKSRTSRSESALRVSSCVSVLSCIIWKKN